MDMLQALIWASTLIFIILSCLGTIVWSVRKVENSKMEVTAMQEGTKQKAIEGANLERQQHVLELEIQKLDRQLERGPE